MYSEETFIQKTIEMINELTGSRKFIPVKLQYLPNTRQILISRALNDIHSHQIPLLNCHIFYFDNFKRLFVHLGAYPFKQDILLKLQIFIETHIQIRYRKISSGNSPKSQSNQGTKHQPNPSIKEKRTKQKTIRQVLQIVSRWRNLFEELDSNGKRINTLQTAAEKLGMQRKTLDDYYYKIKNAVSYGFDLEKNINEKIGSLRQFLKECINNKKQKIAFNPHSFNVKIYPFLSFLVSPNSKIPKPPSTQNSYFAPFQKPDEIDIGKYLADEAVCSSDSQDSSI